MYKISVPIMNATVHAGNRAQYVALFQKAGATRVFLALAENVIPENLKENIQFFQRNAFTFPH